MAISKEIQKSSEMKFNGKLIQVTYDIADVNGKDAWREVVLQRLWQSQGIIRLLWNVNLDMLCNRRYWRYQQEN